MAVEYKRATEQGLANQGWKDLHDAIFHADGPLAEGNIALAEVQGYVYAAKRVAARVAKRLGREALALKLDAEATLLAERFEAAFWCPEIEITHLRSTAPKIPVAYARPMLVRSCSAALPVPIAPHALPRD